MGTFFVKQKPFVNELTNIVCKLIHNLYPNLNHNRGTTLDRGQRASIPISEVQRELESEIRGRYAYL